MSFTCNTCKAKVKASDATAHDGEHLAERVEEARVALYALPVLVRADLLAQFCRTCGFFIVNGSCAIDCAGRT